MQVQINADQHQALMDALKSQGLSTLTANTIATQMLTGKLSQKSIDLLAHLIQK